MPERLAQLLPSDTEMLDWLVRRGASVHYVHSDEWEMGEVPRFIRFSVECHTYTSEPGGGIDYKFSADGSTLREAIANSMALDNALGG